MPAWQCEAGQAGQGGVLPLETPSDCHLVDFGFRDPAAAVIKIVDPGEQHQQLPAAHGRQSSRATTVLGDTVEGIGSKDLETDQQQQRPAAQAELSSSANLPAPLSTPELLFWVLVAAAQPVKTTPPVPPLRVTCLIVIFALPVMLLVHALPLGLLRWRHKRQQQWQQRQQRQQQSQHSPQDVSRSVRGSCSRLGCQLRKKETRGTPADIKERPEAAAAAAATAGGAPAELEGKSVVDGAEACLGGPAASTAAAGAAGTAAVNGAIPCIPRALAKEAPPPATPAGAGLAEGDALCGLQGFCRRNPRLQHYTLRLVISGCYLGVIVLLNTAPKLLDPAVVMLVTMFTVVGVALVGRAFLQVPLSWALPPAAALMIGGSAMVLVPNIKGGAGEPGSLTSVQAWLGFVASLGALALTVMFIILTQASAFKGANIGAMEVLYWITGLTTIFVLPVSLGVEGTDWGPMFASFGGSQWGALLFSACVGHVGAGPLLQYATWKLGGTMASLFFGLRLVVSVVASKLVLGATIIQCDLQVAGIVLVVASITGYTLIQWWTGRQQSAAAKLPVPQVQRELKQQQQQ
ncbi:hypothetical protein N2152v2_009990 [Parachlorella kessleri]